MNVGFACVSVNSFRFVVVNYYHLRLMRDMDETYHSLLFVGQTFPRSCYLSLFFIILEMTMHFRSSGAFKQSENCF